MRLNMAGFVMRSLRSSLPSSSPSKPLLLPRQLGARVRTFEFKSSPSSTRGREAETEKAKKFDDAVPTSGISRPLFEIEIELLKELNKRVGDSLVKDRIEYGSCIKYIPWHIVNRIMNLHAPDKWKTWWSGEVRSISYSADGKTVSVVYRVTLYGTDAETYRESIGTASVDGAGYGDPVQKAEAMAFRQACARFGLGLHLYHEDML